MKTLTQQKLESHTNKNFNNSNTLISLKVREGNLQFADFLHFINCYHSINSLPQAEVDQRYNQLGFESLNMRYSKVSQAESNFGDSLSQRKWEEIKTAPPELIHRLQLSSLFNNNLEIIKINRFEDGYYYYELNSPNKGLGNLLSAEGMINIGGTLLKITQQEIENVSQGTRLTKDEFNQLNNNLYQAGLKDHLVHFKRSRLVNLGQFHNFHVIPEYNHFLDIFAPGSSEMISIANFSWQNDPLKGAGVGGVAIDFGPAGSGMPTKSFSKGSRTDNQRLSIQGYLDFSQVDKSTSLVNRVEVRMVVKGISLKRRLRGLWYDAAVNSLIEFSGDCYGNKVDGYIDPGNVVTRFPADFTFSINENQQGPEFERVLPLTIPPRELNHVKNNGGMFKVIDGSTVILYGNSFINIKSTWNGLSATASIQF